VKRFVAISDLHAHTWSAFAKGDGASNSRLINSLIVLRASLQAARIGKIPWVFGGDLVHTAGYTLNTVLAVLTDVFGEFADVEKLVVWGNHDARGVGGRIVVAETVWAPLERTIPNLHLLDPIEVVEAGGLSFSGAGAQPGNLLRLSEEQTDVGVYHATVRGSKGPNGFIFDYGVERDALLERHGVVIVGDIHHPQQLGSILVPGSPEHHNFGDRGEHGWWIVSVPNNKHPAEFEFIPGGSPKFLTVETPAQVRADGNFYRVQRVGAGEELPENAEAIAPTENAIAARDSLGSITDVEQAVQAWLKAEPPEGDVEPYLAAGRSLLSQQEPTRLSEMRLTRLLISNFCSYDQAELRVQPGTCLVTGKGRDYPSNGAGKSSLFEAIYWLLFGKTTKGLSGDEVIRWGTKECTVIAEFTGEHDHWLQAIRTKGSVSALTVEEGTGEISDHWQATSVTEMTEKLNKRLGITPALYQALGYFSQERLLLFASSTDGERKEMLADLIGLSAYQEASSAAASNVAELERTKLTLEGRCESTQARLNHDRSQLSALEQRNTEWDFAHQRDLALAEGALEEFDAKSVERRRTLAATHFAALSRQVSERIATAARELEALDQQLEAYAGDGTPQVETAQAQVLQLREECTAINRQFDAARVEHAFLIKERDKLAAQAADYATQLAGGHCPMCKQDLDQQLRDLCLDPLRARIVEANQVIERKKADVDRLLQDAGQKQVARDEAETNYQDALAIAKLLEKKAVQWEAVKIARAEKDTLHEFAKSLAQRDLDAERLAVQNRLAAIQRTANPYLGQLSAAQERMEEHGRELAQLAAERNGIAQSQEIFQYWTHGFSKRGLQSLLVDEVAVRFNAMRAEIFPVLTQGVYDVQLSTLSQTKQGEFRERTEFYVTEYGKSVPYEALSGGQRRRVDVGVMLTLVMAVSEWMQVPGALGLLVLDEVFGFLDAAGAEGLMEALRAVEERIPAIFVVAHDPQLQSLFGKTLHVEQDDQGISHLENGNASDEERSPGRAERGAGLSGRKVERRHHRQRGKAHTD